MRMWMVDPKIMCRKHLLGEHVECHMFRSVIVSGKKIDGYIRNNCLEIQNLKDRHDKLAKEIEDRGYNHKSPMEEISSEFFLKWKCEVDPVKSLDDLLERCIDCQERMVAG